MTVSSTARRAGPFTGNGVTTAFPFAFKVFSAADVQLTHTDAAGNATVVASNYAIALNADQDNNPGGTITYPVSGSPMAVGETLVGLGSLEYRQPTDITNAGKFLPQVIEDALDRATIQAQQLSELAGRTVTFPASDPGVPSEIPAVPARAGKFFAFDANGNPIAASGTGADAGLRTDLAATSGDLLVGHQPDGAGADATDVQTAMRRHFIDGDAWVRPSYSGAANVARWAVLAAYIATLAAGAEVRFSRGVVPFNGPIAASQNTTYVGEGRQSTVFQFSHAGDGMQSTWPINASTAANVNLRNIGLVCTNGATAGGGFVDVGGSFVNLQNARVEGFKHGVIFDQSEISSVIGCELKSNTYAGVWLVNGATHTPGANTLYTNRITIANNQFNSNQYHVVDDGGVSHTIENNSINGGVIGVRCAGALVVSIANNEIEFCSTAAIATATTALSSGAAVGQCFEVHGKSNFIVASNAAPGIALGGGANCTFEDNDIESSGGAGAIYAITGVSTCPSFKSESNRQVGFLGMLDSYPAKFWQWDASDQKASYFTFQSADRLLSAMGIFCPSNFGGGASISGIDLQAWNGASAKVTYATLSPAIWSNAVGAETGGVNLNIVSGGAMTPCFSFKTTEFYPLADNTLFLGDAAHRWSTVYAGTGAINTSDARDKQQGRPIGDAEKAVALKVKAALKVFKFNDAVEKKGDAARWHFGVYAQQVADAFASEGLDPHCYGLFCYDEWGAEPEMRDKNGVVVLQARPAGGRYGIRYDELLVFMLAAL